MEIINIEGKSNNELQDKFITPERATELAVNIQEKIDFLKSVEKKIYSDKILTEQEQEEKDKLFGDEDLKKYLMNFGMSDLENKHYQFSTAGINGAQNVEISFPTGMNHKESEFENWAKEHEMDIKNLYHYAGTIIDRASETIVGEYNINAKLEQKIGWENEEPHARRWFSAEFVENTEMKGLHFTFGATEYRLIKNTDNKWYVALTKKGFSLTPKFVDNKLKDLDHKVASWLQDRANQTLH